MVEHDLFKVCDIVSQFQRSVADAVFKAINACCSLYLDGHYLALSRPLLIPEERTQYPRSRGIGGRSFHAHKCA